VVAVIPVEGDPERAYQAGIVQHQRLRRCRPRPNRLTRPTPLSALGAGTVDPQLDQLEPGDGSPGPGQRHSGVTVDVHTERLGPGFVPTVVSGLPGHRAMVTSATSATKGRTMATIEVGDVRLAYDTYGDGPPVVLVCGTGQAAYTWSLFQVPALVQAGYQAVTFDNRGMPPSDCPAAPYTVPQMAGDVAGLIEALGLAPCRVVGFSLGAFVTQELALARPDLLRAAVMMGTLGRQDGFRQAVTQSWVELDRSGIVLPRLYEAVSSAFSLFSASRLSDDEGVQQYLGLTLGAPQWTGPGRLGQHEADLAYQDRLDALGGIRVPSLVIAFEHDMLTAVPLCQEVAKAIPGCGYVEIAGVGHLGAFEQPDEVNQALLRFFGKP
jgi:pimeloyl-ACP methyl ester carboxylesterase